MPHLRIEVSFFMRVIALTIVVAINGAAAEKTNRSEEKTFEPTSQYSVQKIEGWTVLASPYFRKNNKLLRLELSQLGNQLARVEQTVPMHAIEELRTVKIWLDSNDNIPSGGGYYNGQSDSGIDPDKRFGIDITTPGKFLALSKDRNVLMHELAHAYHQQFVDHGFENPDVKAAYANAISNELYNSVLDLYGNLRSASDSIADVEEYFAVTSEAFFGTASAYPFVRSELKQHDPRMYALLEKLWGGEANAVAAITAAFDRNRKLTLTIINNNDAPALLFWLGKDGKRNDFYGVVKPHEPFPKITFSGDHWGIWFFPSDRRLTFAMPDHYAQWEIAPN